MGNRASDGPLDVAQQRALLLGAEREGAPLASGAPRAADAVDVGLGNLRQVVVDHQRQLRDVDASRGDVGGNQHVQLARLEVAEGLLPGALRLVAVDGPRGDAAARERADDAVGAVFGAGEDERRALRRPAQQLGKQGALVGLLDEVDLLADGLDHRGRRGDGHMHRVVEQLFGQRGDVGRHRGREEQRLLLAGQQRQQPFDVVDEAHVEHAVRLVEHEVAHGVEREPPLPQQVKQAARRGDEQVDALLERLDLGPLADAAEDDRVADAREAGVVAAAGVNLDGQLARGGENQSPYGASSARGGRGVEQLDERQREGRRLARAGLGAAQQVAPGQHGRNGLLLNGGGGIVPDCFDGPLQRGRQCQVVECHACCNLRDLRRQPLRPLPPLSPRKGPAGALRGRRGAAKVGFIVGFWAHSELYFLFL